MTKLIIASILGGIILFVWGWLTWSLIPIHNTSISNIENEEAVVSAMHINMDKKSVYVFPGIPMTQDQATLDEYTQKMQRGPVGMIIYDPQGSEPMMPGQMIVGFILTIISSFFAAWFLSRSTAAASTYIARIAFCGMLGVFISIVSHLTNWNWMGYPIDYTMAWILDSVIGWLLAGLGIAAIIKIPKIETS